MGFSPARIKSWVILPWLDEMDPAHVAGISLGWGKLKCRFRWKRKLSSKSNITHARHLANVLPNPSLPSLSLSSTPKSFKITPSQRSAADSSHTAFSTLWVTPNIRCRLQTMA
ncbi:hypothetical protein NPIL_597431 [Nephila pilipes]|uniref:Uncharacterized protein n=1 Tax=Nephila pilipes TaxID=299642 RepID=A0A8X6Q575_NEPPI|nr:hypothetical protein NPIL_597431 [Nephila pilipes]